MEPHCPLCDLAVPPTRLVEGVGTRTECRRCGTYVISEYVLQELYGYGLLPTPNLAVSWEWSGAIREQNMLGAVPVISQFEQLGALGRPPSDPLGAIDKLLIFVSRSMGGSANAEIHFDAEMDYPAVYAHDAAEMTFLIEKSVQLGYLEVSHPNFHRYRLDLTGWKRLSEIQKDRANSNQAFVAMWFDPALTLAYTDGFAPALDTCGYRPTRIDLHEHNEKIDDRIISEIRRSGLLVADFTGHRGGVYFEAGFAMGLGLPVIWTCRQDHIGDAHFDTRQYNHIVWEEPEDLREKLANRIAATVPRFGTA